MSHEAPAVSLINQIISNAIQLGASDIHLEPLRNMLRVRFRIDGILYEQESIDQEYSLQVVSRLKVLSNMNIAEKRIPQDGKFFYSFNNNEIDLRVATFPSVNGEKVVIRILDKNYSLLSLDNLGFELEMLQKIKKLAKRSGGFFLVTGPTGSGKTTTLHCMLNLINSKEKNIVTLEDPVEYNIDGITQSQVYPEVGFNFERGIRSLLRQDPDIIMVGEIRDKETAQVAIQAALTGHLVLSTLHTNDAAGAIMRLLEMAIEPFLINAALTGVLAQRLVRKLCTSCRTKQSVLTQEEHDFIKKLSLPIKDLYISTGCGDCNNLGYKGRLGVFELLDITHDLRALITSNANFSSISKQSLADGMTPLLHDAAAKVNSGVISLYELARVLT